MLPKAQPGRTFFKSLVCYRLNGFKTNLPDEKHSSISERMSQNECKRATAIKTPYVSFVQNKSRLLAANVLVSFIRVGNRSWVKRLHLTETIKRGILRQEHLIRLWRLMHSQRYKKKSEILVLTAFIRKSFTHTCEIRVLKSLNLSTCLHMRVVKRYNNSYDFSLLDKKHQDGMRFFLHIFLSWSRSLNLHLSDRV